jgi:hypothetical protein
MAQVTALAGAQKIKAGEAGFIKPSWGSPCFISCSCGSSC